MLVSGGIPGNRTAAVTPRGRRNSTSTQAPSRRQLLVMGPRGVGYLRQFWPRFRRSGTLDKELSLALMRSATAEEVGGLLQL